MHETEHETERSAKARKAAEGNRGKNRRKGQGHPATADLNYTPREWEFLLAVDRYKRKTGKMFPTLAEVLRVIDSLGYIQTWRDPPPEDLPVRTCGCGHLLGCPHRSTVGDPPKR